MRKALVLLVCLVSVFLIACTTSQNDESYVELSVECSEKERYSPTRHRLDIEFEALMSAHELDTNANARLEIIWRYREKWEFEMEQYLALMEFRLEEDVWALVAESQSNWEIFVESDLRLTETARQHYFQGATISRAYRAKEHYEKYRNRTLHLIMLYEYLTADHRV